MEEWQDPDSGYLNCIGVGDSYVKKQIERILNREILNADIKIEGNMLAFCREINIKQ